MKNFDIPLESLLEAVLSVSDLIFCLDREGTFLHVRTNGHAPLTFPPEEFLGKRLEEILEEDLAQKTRFHLEKAFTEGHQVFEYEIEVKGKKKDYEATLVAVDPKHCMAFVRDITKRKQAERELRQSKTFLQNIFDGLRDGLSILDRELNIIKVNYWMKQRYLHAVPLEGKKCYEVYQQRNSICPWCPSVRTLATGKPSRAIVPYVTDKGQEGWIELCTFPLKDENGQLLGVIEDCKDITDKMKTEEDLRRLAMAVEQSNEGIAILDAAGRIVYVNPAFEKITGYPRSEVDAFSPPLASILEQEDGPLAQAIREGWNWQGEVSFSSPKQKLNLEISLSPIRDAREQIKHFVVVLHDVTQRVMLERQLRQSQKLEAIGRLAGGIAHDFNNILTAVIGYSELLLLHLPPEAPERKYAEQIFKALKRATALTEKLLSFSRKKPPKNEIFDARNVLAETMPLLERLIPESVEVSSKLGEGILPVEGDPSHFEQILLNLVLNAVEATDGEGRIEIELDSCQWPEGKELPPGNYLCLTVRDNGKGIPPEFLERIFDPFFTTKESGSGLGLFVVYNTVKQLRGTIFVESEPPAGTTFRVFLPLSTKELSAPIISFEEPSPEETSSTILLAEDEEAVRNFLKEILEREGFRVLDAPNGRQALKIMADHPGEIDLLLTDVVMPEMGGFELWEEFRRRYPKSRVLFISGHPKTSSERLEQLSEENFLPKPFGARDLLARISALLK